LLINRIADTVGLQEFWWPPPESKKFASTNDYDLSSVRAKMRRPKGLEHQWVKNRNDGHWAWWRRPAWLLQSNDIEPVKS